MSQYNGIFSWSKTGEEETNKNYISEKLKGKMNAQNSKEMYIIASEFCEYKCDNTDARSNPVITCAGGCPIWKVKNIALHLKEQ